MTRAKAPEVRFPLPGSVPGSMPKTPGRGLCAGMGAQRCFDRRSPRWRAVPAWTASAVAANRMGCFSKQWVFFSASDIREGRWKDLQIFSFAPSQTHYQNGPEPIVIEGAGSARCVVPCALPAPSSHPPPPIPVVFTVSTGLGAWMDRVRRDSRCCEIVDRVPAKRMQRASNAS